MKIEIYLQRYIELRQENKEHRSSLFQDFQTLQGLCAHPLILEDKSSRFESLTAFENSFELAPKSRRSKGAGMN